MRNNKVRFHDTISQMNRLSTFLHVTQEMRGILADMSISETHPSTLERPRNSASKKEQVIHGVHASLYRLGKVANVGYRRKLPAWPLPISDADDYSILGYGAEKIAYRVRTDDDRKDAVLSVYHKDSLLQTPLELAVRKKRTYETYKQFFGQLVVPTMFMIIDNPWGNGNKLASLQPYVENTADLSQFETPDLVTKAQTDPDFSANLQLLTKGYRNMTNAGLYPDFASSNLYISGSELPIFDTGLLYSDTNIRRVRNLHPNYELVEGLLDQAA